MIRLKGNQQFPCGEKEANLARITFTYPDFESLGVEYLMAVCADEGHDVSFVFYEAEDTYIGRKRKDLSYEKVAIDILNTKPDIVAFSCVTDNYQYQLNLAKALKNKNKDIATIFGGIHPTAAPEKTLQNDEIDAVAIGEAEYSLPALLTKSKFGSGYVFPDEAVDGVIFKKNGKFIGALTEGKLVDIDALPFPFKAPFVGALKDSAHEYRIMASRGCPYSCSFCFNSCIHRLRGGVKIRRRSVSNVIEELLVAKKQFSIKYVLFVDDSFTTSKLWIKQFYKRYRAEVDLPFACVANPFYIDEEITEFLADAGCVNIQLGIQSLSESLCKQVLNRKSNNIQIAKTIQRLKHKNIMVQVDHMLGIPGDTIEDQENSVLFYNINRPNLISIFWLTYYPKTDIIKLAQDLNIIDQQQIEAIEQGIKLTNESYLTGGSLTNPRPYYSISFLMNWLPFLPKQVVLFLVKSRWYRLFSIKNFYFSTALPRIIQSILNKKDFRGRSHIIRFIDKVLS